MKKHYSRPELNEFGTIAAITAAIGGSADVDQSDFPQSFPPDHGSFDVCNNQDPNSTC